MDASEPPWACKLRVGQSGVLLAFILALILIFYSAHWTDMGGVQCWMRFQGLCLYVCAHLPGR